MNHKFNKILVIAGPTASGKSWLAQELAITIGASIINADSMQSYSGLEILSASPTKGPVPHYLYGYLSPAETGSVAEWVQRVVETIRRIETPIIIVGGTGLYLSVLLKGLSPLPSSDRDYRAFLNQQERTKGLQALYNHLCTLDPDHGLKAGDAQRIKRALEVWHLSGKPIRFFQKNQMIPLPSVDFKKILIMPPRAALYERINKRVIQMLEQGAMEQVLKLKDPGPGIQKTIGYLDIIAFAKGELSEPEMVLKIQQRTRQYAKRQMTWFRHQFEADLQLDDFADKKDVDRIVSTYHLC